MFQANAIKIRQGFMIGKFGLIKAIPKLLGPKKFWFKPKTCLVLLVLHEKLLDKAYIS